MLQVFGSDSSLFLKGLPITIASLVELDYEIVDVLRFRGHLPQRNAGPGERSPVGG